MDTKPTGKYAFTYLTAHGTPAELIDRAFGIIEEWANRYIATVAEAVGDSEVYAVLGRLSLKEKLDLLIPDGVESLDDEHGEGHIFRELYDLIRLRPAMAGPGAHATLQTWLRECGWYDSDLQLPHAPEPLLSEIVLRITLDGSLIYLDGWFEGLAQGEHTRPA